jgi:hypothetical protein
MTAVEQNLATKTDIELLRRDMKELETGLQRDMKELEMSLRRELKEFESRMTMRLGGLIVAGVGALAVLMRLL